MSSNVAAWKKREKRDKRIYRLGIIFAFLITASLVANVIQNFQTHQITQQHSGEIASIKKTVDQTATIQGDHASTLTHIDGITNQLKKDLAYASNGLAQGKADYQAICDSLVLLGCKLPYPATGHP